VGRIVVSENVSLDGVVQDPAGDEGFKVGGWVGKLKDRDEVSRLALSDAMGAEALLLGRRSYEWFASKFPSRTGALADRLNHLPKFVVSSTLEDPVWKPSTILKGDALSEVYNLKRGLSGEILALGSFQLVHMLIDHDLVDELRLNLYPVVLGAGARLFGETVDTKSMRLVDSRSLSDGVVVLKYQTVRDS
jgi:dihydrofolate reductase